MLDETKTKANIYVIEYKYDVEPPAPRRRMSTIESLDAPSELGGYIIGEGKSGKKVTEKKMSAIDIDGADIGMMNVGKQHKKSGMSHKELRKRIIEADKKKAAEEKKRLAEEKAA